MIKNIVIDCDGVLTDGKKYVDETGKRVQIAFHSRDNVAIQRLIAVGYRVIIATASKYPGIRAYWERYGVEVYNEKLKEVIGDLAGLKWSETLGVGDDIIDFMFLQQCALAYVPADAHPELLGAFSALETKGGAGIMAEVYNLLVNKYSLTEQISIA